MKKIPLKNYFILVVLLVVSTFIAIFLINLYKESQKQTSIISEHAKEIKPSELDNYIIENSHFIVYISNKKNNQCKNYENKLKTLLLDKNLLNDVVYIDLGEFSSYGIDRLIDKYYDDDYVLKPSDVIIITFENQKIKNILSKSAEAINIDMTKKFFKENGVY